MPDHVAIAKRLKVLPSRNSVRQGDVAQSEPISVELRTLISQFGKPDKIRVQSDDHGMMWGVGCMWGTSDRLVRKLGLPVGSEAAAIALADAIRKL